MNASYHDRQIQIAEVLVRHRWDHLLEFLGLEGLVAFERLLGGDSGRAPRSCLQAAPPWPPCRPGWSTPPAPGSAKSSATSASTSSARHASGMARLPPHPGGRPGRQRPLMPPQATWPDHPRRHRATAAAWAVCGVSRRPAKSQELDDACSPSPVQRWQTRKAREHAMWIDSPGLGGRYERFLP